LSPRLRGPRPVLVLGLGSRTRLLVDEDFPGFGLKGLFSPGVAPPPPEEREEKIRPG